MIELLAPCSRVGALLAAAFAVLAHPARAADPPNERPQKTAWQSGLDKVLVEAGAMPDAAQASGFASLRASPYVQWQPSRRWEFRAGLALAADTQRGGTSRSSDSELDLADTYLRFRGGDTRVTVGTQTVVWGRVDAVPLIDRVSRVDLRRFVLDDLQDRRMAQPMVRWEQSLDSLKFDAAVLPVYLRAALPPSGTVWSPIDRRAGRVLGLPELPQIAAIARSAPLIEAERGFGGAAIRVTHGGDDLDLGLTLARTRSPLPYFRVDAARRALISEQALVPFVGGDAEWVVGNITYRTELGFTRDVPATRPDGTAAKTNSVEWVGGLEFFPGGKDTRVNLQLLARRLNTDGPVLELTKYVGVNGEIQSTLAQGRWKLGLRFFSGLNVNDLYLSPRISFVGWEPHEIYLAAHHFRGENRTLGGFHRDHGYLALGLKTRF